MTGFPFPILGGVWLTLGVAVCALLLALLLGALTALVLASRITPLAWLARGYTLLIRGIPELLWLWLLFYGGQRIINELSLQAAGHRLEISPFMAGVLALGVVYGAHLAMTLHQARLAIPDSERLAAINRGLGPLQIFFDTTLPQTLQGALPGFISHWASLLKATALVSLLGLPDMLFLARQAALATPTLALPSFLLAAAVYVLLGCASVALLRALQNRHGIHTPGKVYP